MQKVFPDAVTKDEEGYLSIRYEDMFYAVINAIKELDKKITKIVQNITDINSILQNQNKTIAEQQKTIEELRSKLQAQSQVQDELVKRIEKLERGK